MSRYDERDELGHTPYLDGSSVKTYNDGIVIKTPEGSFPLLPDTIRNIVLYFSLATLDFIKDMGLLQGPVVTPPEVWDFLDIVGGECDPCSTIVFSYDKGYDDWEIHCYPEVSGHDLGIGIRVDDDLFKLFLTDCGNFMEVADTKYGGFTPWIIREKASTRTTTLIGALKTLDMVLCGTTVVLSSTNDDKDFWFGLFDQMEHLLDECLVGATRRVRKQDASLQDVIVSRVENGVLLTVKDRLDGEVFAVGSVTITQNELDELEYLVRRYYGLTSMVDESDDGGNDGEEEPVWRNPEGDEDEAWPD